MKKWVAIDRAFGSWEIVGSFDTKKEAIENATRNSCSGYNSTKMRDGVYEISFVSDSSACVCKSVLLDSLGYI